MSKPLMTRTEVENISEEMFFSIEEKAVLTEWLKGKTLIQTSMILHLSTASISRIRHIIKNKLKIYKENSIEK